MYDDLVFPVSFAAIEPFHFPSYVFWLLLGILVCLVVIAFVQIYKAFIEPKKEG